MRGVLAVFFGVLASTVAPGLSAQEDLDLMTRAGTRIVNMATVTYRTANGETGTARSNDVVMIVGQVAALDVEPSRELRALPGQTLLLSHTVRNVGNGADAAVLGVTAPADWPSTLYLDVDGDGAITDVDSVLTDAVDLPFGGIVSVLISVDVPVDFTSAGVMTVGLTATSTVDASVSDMAVDRIRSAAATVETDLEKRVDLTRAAPGQVLTYTLVYEVTGSAEAGPIVLEDRIPELTRYVPGSLIHNGVVLTDAEDADAGRFDASDETVRLSLTPDATGELTFQVRLSPDAPVNVSVTNRAAFVIGADRDDEGATDEVTTGVVAPDLSFQKRVSGPTPAVEGDALVYTIVVKNHSTDVPVSGVTVVDTIPEPLTAVTVLPAADEVDGVLTWADLSVAPADSLVLTVVTTVDEIDEPATVVNRARLHVNGEAEDMAGVESALDVVPDPALIELTLESEVLSVSLGETLPLTVTVTNTGEVSVTNLEVRMIVPEGARYAGSTDLTGVFEGFRSDAVVAIEAGDGPAAASGRSARYTSPLRADSVAFENGELFVHFPGHLLPEESVRFEYLLGVVSGESRVLQNQAVARARRGELIAEAGSSIIASNEDVAWVTLERNRPMETRTALGKVWLDANGNGVQDGGERGIEGVDIWTEDGEIVSTDTDGKFSFVNLRPGRHAFRLDFATVPVELRVDSDGPESGMRVLDSNGWTSSHVTFGLVPHDAMASAVLTVDEADVVGDSTTCMLLGNAVAMLEVGTAITAGCELPADTDLHDGAPRRTVREAVLALEPNALGWPGVAYRLPEGWSVVEGTSRVGGRAVGDPSIDRARNGELWMTWTASGAPDEVRVRLREEGAVLEAVESVRIPALRTGEERESEKAQAFVRGPHVEFFAPEDGTVFDSDRIFVGVRGEPGHDVHLFLGDSILAEATLRPDGVHDFIGVHVAPGTHRLRVRMTNSWSQVRWDSIAVHVSGAPTRLDPEFREMTVRADGVSTEVLRARVFDASEVPVVHSPYVTVEMSGGRPVGPDADPSSIGHQIRVDESGWATVRMIPGRDVGTGWMRLSSGDAGAVVPLKLLPPLRPLMMTGVAQFSVGAGGRSFAAMTARGRLDDRTSLTLSVDSRRLNQGREVFGRVSDPLEEGRYATVGDRSESRSLTSSRERVSARIERDLDWVAFGDITTANFGDDLTLGRYGRSLPGVAAQVSTGPVTLEAFGARTSQALRQTNIQGRGTSGPYELGDEVVPGTEEIRMEVRARENATRIVSERVLQRFVDYQIDYEAGTILLKQAIPATDAAGNPVYIVATHEGGGDGPSASVWGLRGSTDLSKWISRGDSIPVGIMMIEDRQPGSEFRLTGADIELADVAGLDLRAEVAYAQAADSSGIATLVEAESKLFDDRVTLSGRWMDVGAEFTNPSNVALRAGTRELQLGAAMDFDGTTVRIDHERQTFASRELDRGRTTVSVARSVAPGLDAEIRLADEATTSTSATQSSAAGEYKLTWKANNRLSMWTEYRDQMRSTGDALSAGDYFGGGASLKLTDRATLEARHVKMLSSELTDGYTLTNVGVKSELATGVRAWGSYQLTGGIDQNSNAAIVGLSHTVQLTESFSLNGMLERRKGVENASPGDALLAQPFSGPQDDYFSMSLGAEFTPTDAPYELTGRAEVKNGELESSRIASLAGHVEFNRSLALITKQELLQREQTLTNGTSERESRFSLLGLALRPADTETLNVLFSFQYRDEVNPAAAGVLTQQGDETRMTLASEIIWNPRSDLELGARFATRRTSATVTGTQGLEAERTSSADFVGARFEMHLLPWMGVRAEGRMINEDFSDSRKYDVAPSTIFRPVEGLEIQTGYRFGDLQDPDFAVHSGNGWFLSVGMRITEATLPTTAAFWKSRIGG